MAIPAIHLRVVHRVLKSWRRLPTMTNPPLRVSIKARVEQSRSQSRWRVSSARRSSLLNRMNIRAAIQAMGPSERHRPATAALTSAT